MDGVRRWMYRKFPLHRCIVASSHPSISTVPWPCTGWLYTDSELLSNHGLGETFFFWRRCGPALEEPVVLVAFRLQRWRQAMNLISWGMAGAYGRKVFRAWVIWPMDYSAILGHRRRPESSDYDRHA